jgi:uncharacterized OsmC-like protein
MEPTPGVVNGIDTNALRRLAEGVAHDACSGVAPGCSRGDARFEVTTSWKGGTRSDTRVEAWHLGGRRLSKDFTLRCDEPSELLGGNTAPNPQEMLMAAFNACMTVGYVANCALRGIRLRSLTIHTEGCLDLRGFLGLDESVPPGYEDLRTTVRISADATDEQLREIHEAVLRLSPNSWHLGRAIPLHAELAIDSAG